MDYGSSQGFDGLLGEVNGLWEMDFKRRNHEWGRQENVQDEEG